MRRFTEDDFGLTWLMDSFHADWTSYAASEVEVLNLTLTTDIDSRQIACLRRDAGILVAKLSSDTIERLWESGIEVESLFGRRISTGSQWMEMIVEKCGEWSSRREIAPLGEFDRDDGFDSTDAILEEFQAVDIDSKVASALTQCGLHCTPELAFRLF